MGKLPPALAAYNAKRKAAGKPKPKTASKRPSTKRKTVRKK